MFEYTNKPEAIEVKSNSRLERIARFRTDVWLLDGFLRHEQLTDGVFRIDGDEFCRHWIVEESDKIVGTGRLSLHESLTGLDVFEFWKDFERVIPMPFGYLSRLVVHPAFRKKGLAKVLDQTRIDAARNLGCKSILGVPVGGREQTLAKFGFYRVAWDEEFYTWPYYETKRQPVMMMLL